MVVFPNLATAANAILSPSPVLFMVCAIAMAQKMSHGTCVANAENASSKASVLVATDTSSAIKAQAPEGRGWATIATMVARKMASSLHAFASIPIGHGIPARTAPVARVATLPFHRLFPVSLLLRLLRIPSVLDLPTSFPDPPPPDPARLPPSLARPRPSPCPCPWVRPHHPSAKAGIRVVPSPSPKGGHTPPRPFRASPPSHAPLLSPPQAVGVGVGVRGREGIDPATDWDRRSWRMGEEDGPLPTRWAPFARNRP
eukprot:scaffold2858_cov659-Pavlova_lutheri.AAC.78